MYFFVKTFLCSSSAFSSLRSRQILYSFLCCLGLKPRVLDFDKRAKKAQIIVGVVAAVLKYARDFIYGSGSSRNIFDAALAHRKARHTERETRLIMKQIGILFR